MRLLHELKRRNVIRVAGLYLVGGWVMVQVAETLFPAFDVPNWVLRAMVIVLALGFIPALIISWVFEMTPDGLKRDDQIDVPRSGESSARKLDITVIALLLVIGAFQLWMHFRPGEPLKTEVAAQPAAAESSTVARSIAVLAFTDLSAEKDQEYFADGISEELLNLLARIDGLKVAARTSSFKFKGQQVDIGEIGQALGVDTVLEGSIRKAGDQVRITAQLVKTSDGFHLWSESYDRKLENIFAVQDEIAAAIVNALKLKLDIASETASRTESVAAYDLYLRGRQQARAPSRDGLLLAIEFYEQALAIDPEFAAAWSGIAEAWVWLEDYGGFSAAEAYPKAELAARKALQLDPDSAEANTAVAFVQDRYYSDLVQAQNHFERTLAINPNYVSAYTMYADTLRDLGQPARMLEIRQRAAELDPLSTFFQARLVDSLRTVGKGDEAEHLLGTLLEKHPGDDYVLEELGNSRMQKGRVLEASQTFLQVHEIRPGDPYSAAQLAIIGVLVNDPIMTAAWIEAARQRGTDNRWELRAREEQAISLGDWPALEKVGTLRGGYRGALIRGFAAMGESRWADARRAFIESLQLGGHRTGQALSGQSIDAMLMLAWLEKRDNNEAWRERASEARVYLERVLSEGGLNADDTDTHYQLAQLAALEGDRERALAELRVAVGQRAVMPEFLDRDPLLGMWKDDPGFVQVVQGIRDRAEKTRPTIIAAGLQRPPTP